jgi:hypothetical protein
VTQVILNFTGMMSVMLAPPTLDIYKNKTQSLTLECYRNEFLKTKPKA